ncbi:hypothetical protein BDN71DRAFT_317460 [Pleurotus eryngii]|uniref:Uncharacterized protein n=1 Tax=Pleurotus eryngii TaxID=5323 RepID=A0A9P5ZKG6_PLEER|nr:hypothetical protein BDN71DRAFT_317460 [Pleurotus eryngii]
MSHMSEVFCSPPWVKHSESINESVTRDISLMSRSGSGGKLRHCWARSVRNTICWFARSHSALITLLCISTTRILVLEQQMMIRRERGFFVDRHA